MMFYFIFKPFIYLPQTIASYILAWRDQLFFRKHKRHLYVSPVSFHAALLFPVHLAQAFIQSASSCLSCVRIPVHWCDGKQQRSYAIRRRGKKFRPRSVLALLGLLALSTLETAHAIPSTDYALVKEKTNDLARQIKEVDKIINSLTNAQSNEQVALNCGVCCPSEGAANESNRYLKHCPETFIADTDSAEFILDTGTNAFIVTDRAMLRNYKKSRGKVKGVNGKSTSFHGTGLLNLTLTFDCGTQVTVEVKGVHIQDCPYNLISPQLLIAALKKDGSSAKCEYDDERHIIQFIDEASESPKVLTSFLRTNRLYSIRANQGYRSFFTEVAKTLPEWCCFAGALHVIPSDDEEQNGTSTTVIESDEPSPPDSSETTEVEQTREESPNIVEDETDSEDEAKTVNEPRSVQFQDDEARIGSDDPAIVALQQKQAKLIEIHERLGHFSFLKLRLMAKAGLIPRELANVPVPICPGCAYGKAHRKPTRSKGKRKQLKKATRPGEVVSMDQLVSPTAGFVPTHRGTPTTKRYIGATVFVDHFSVFTYVHLMTKLDAESTVEAKNAFERIANSHGVRVSHYHSDNGLFDTKLFKQSIDASKQTLSFCGPNAHHQNGKAENRIKDVTTHARTALLHAAHRWPEAVNAHLWPAALKHYTNVRNALPTEFVPEKKVGRRKEHATMHGSPLSKFSESEVEPNLDHFHPFGCPVYVLESELQAQHSHNKWSDRSKVGIFLCHSPKHASSVPLILNTQTGNVAPQFHCVYDDNFSTCKRDAKFVSLWQSKSKLSPLPIRKDIERSTILPTIATNSTPSEETINAVAPPASRLTVPNDTPQSHEEAPPVPPTTAETPTLDETPQDSPPPNPTPTSTQTEPTAETPQRFSRSGRAIIPPRIFTLMTAFLAATTPCVARPDEPVQQLLQPDIESTSEPHPLAMLSAFVGTSDPDTMTLQEALKEPDCEEFIKAMRKELMDHIQRKHWKVVPLKSIPKPKRPIPMVWSMKRKKDPLGNIIKWKARLCAGGHKSVEFIDYWSTYSPVVTWSTVRLMIVMTLINNWHIRSVDFVLAFPQAPVKTDIFMSAPKVPRGFDIPDLPRPSDRLTKCYQLIKNLYGLKDAGKTWFDFLSKGLQDRGWEPSSVDTCLFTKPGIILMVYVDDAILISADEKRIDQEIKSLQESFSLTDDGPLKDYLGTHFIRNDDGTLEMTQPKMIERALNIVGLDKEGAKMHDTPASESKILDKDPDGEPRKQPWNYRSAVGCLSYIQAMIRPDITMAVQQCARFCNDPKREHEEAVKRICRYLLHTKDKGMIYKPDLSRGLECYVDADWAGSWQQRSSGDPLSAHSRTGFVIMYAGCPIVWASKMQTLIALSTTEAEYIALSTALREVIGVMNLVNELNEKGFKLNTGTPKVVCRTFEDNRSCIEIATNHKTRPRTKHLSVRLHHFRSKVVDGSITIEHISTKEQIADIFTKPLPRDQFIKLSTALMSWSLVSNREGVRE